MNSSDPDPATILEDIHQARRSANGQAFAAYRDPLVHGRSGIRVAWAGYLANGLPGVLAVLAFAATVEQFGLWPAVTDALLPALVCIAPLVAWVIYTVRRTIGWLVTAALSCMVLFLTPMFFWAPLSLLVVFVELMCICAIRFRRAALQMAQSAS